MQCMGCRDDFPRKQISFCPRCKAWYCKECMQDHSICNPKQEPTPTKNVTPPAQAVEDETPPARKPFDALIFRQFQMMGGCVNTQEAAILLWRQVKDSLTKEEHDVIMNAWIVVSHGEGRKLPIISLNDDRCDFDDVCEKVARQHTKSQDFIG